MQRNFYRLFILILTVVMASGCQKAYFKAMEGVGVHKRDIMVSRIEDARESQQEGQQQFADALEQFKSVVAVSGGDLEKQYNKLNDSYQDSKSKADEISNRIDKVEAVSVALFDEWQDELSQYSSASLRNSSELRLNQTKRKYENLMRAMRRAEKSIQPVLTVLKDNTLYLKHNLNAAAIGQIRNELGSVDRNVKQLIAVMEASIAESDAFIAQLQGN